MSSYNFDFNDPRSEGENAGPATTPTEFRLRARANGYQPIPARGKKPALDGWTGLGNVSDDDIRSWERLCVANTGLLTATTPTLDLDLLDAATVAEMVRYVRELFQGILIRTGQAPKCCIPFRTDTPFKKLTRKFTHPATGNDEQKIEFLAEGQHFVADGMHPDTRAPYTWLDRDPRAVRRQDLPCINAEMAELLVDLLVDIARAHGYQPIDKDTKGINGAGAQAQAQTHSAVPPPPQPTSAEDRAYAQAALDSECNALAQAGKGDRNNALNNASLKLHQLVAAGVLTAEEVEARLIEAAKANGSFAEDGEKQVRATIRSGAKLGLTQPRQIPRRDVFGLSAPAKLQPGPPRAIDDTIAVFQRWLLLPDITPLYAVFGTLVANIPDSDPVWLGLIGTPSTAKSEILRSLGGLPYVVRAATLTVGGLLSGTPKKQHAAGARGGLLNQIGGSGIIVLKDFTSILSLRPDIKAEVLAALREIYDGEWVRVLGTDGGRTLTWRGKVGLLFGSTPVIDRHHTVIGAMGDRFLLSRLVPPDKQLQQALAHRGGMVVQMRQELAQAVTDLLNTPRAPPVPLTADEQQWLEDIARLVVRLRGVVERDYRTHEIEAVYGVEGTARFGLCLDGLLTALSTFEVERSVALNVVRNVALDSVPPMRRQAYEYLCSEASRWERRDGAGKLVDCGYTTAAVARHLSLPTNTVRRVLEDLAAYDLLERVAQGSGRADLWAAKPI
jgi:Bifunctional DNA primase/polymerase, N-terminal